MIATLILKRDEYRDLHDQEGHLRNAAGQRLDDQRALIPDQNAEAPAGKGDEELKYHVNAIIEDDFWQVVKEKFQDGDFKVESYEQRSIPAVHHGSTESVVSCETVIIMTHEEFRTKQPHPPEPFRMKYIDRYHEQVADQHIESTDNRQSTPIIDRRAPLYYRVQLSKIDIARLNALRNPSQPSETSTENISEQSEDAPDLMQVDQATVGRTLRKRKE
ncbi:hypothetical protein F2Q70_00043125 [Brassica cretica]|uniref:Uncharacterized protein n=1 Tax=Brassica cretica TaxID=69181 RepID=A0A8S9KNM2_BRACR|nr:hypothetical protein F2Q70_00043125 [Brassica cretica]